MSRGAITALALMRLTFPRLNTSTAMCIAPTAGLMLIPAVMELHYD